MYLMLLSDSIIAGYFIGASGVAGINAITPVTAVVTFFGDLVSTGVGIVFTREIGAMRKDRRKRSTVRVSLSASASGCSPRS